METLDLFFGHWPFCLIVLIFAVIGQVTSKRLFTKERAYLKARFQPFWWWGRESLPLHPIATGAILGIWWQNPENADPAWGMLQSMTYFAGAGTVSLIGWILAKGWLKRRGIELTLPGDSAPPGSAP